MRDATLSDLSGVYEAYSGKVRAHATKLLGRDEAEDVVQEVFIKVGRSLATLSDPSKLSAWIYAITLNTVRDLARKRAASPDRLAATTGSPRGADPVDSSVAALPDTRSRTPEELLARAEMVACFLDYVNKLPRSQYVVYVLSEFEDLSNDAIARRLSLTVATVKIRLHRARARLYKDLKANCRCSQNARGELMGEPKNPVSRRRRRPS